MAVVGAVIGRLMSFRGQVEWSGTSTEQMKKESKEMIVDPQLKQMVDDRVQQQQDAWQRHQDLLRRVDGHAKPSYVAPFENLTHTAAENPAEAKLKSDLEKELHKDVDSKVKVDQSMPGATDQQTTADIKAKECWQRDTGMPARDDATDSTQASVLESVVEEADEDIPELYRDLGMKVPPVPSVNEIAGAFRKQNLMYNPEYYPDASYDERFELSDKFYKARRAYRRLKNDRDRTRYNKRHNLV